jgi:sugar (pentulose or hexulose) kinase
MPRKKVHNREWARAGETCTCDELTHRLPTIHIIGGGSRNRLLNQFAADATGRTVVAGPVEATAIRGEGDLA